MSAGIDTLVHELRPARGEPDGALVLLHGRALAGWLDALPQALGVPWSQTVLGGFSMGAVMSYALGLGAGRPAPAGVLALSGFIPTVEGFELDLSGRQGFPVAIGHGTEDPVIPVQFARDARRRLVVFALTLWIIWGLTTTTEAGPGS